MANKVNHDETVVKIIEQCQVGPPPGSVPSTSLPLTFFDLPFLCCPVTCTRIFFYEFPHTTTHFMQTLLPNLKHSLSLTLQHFFPLSSNIVFPPKPQAPHILYSQGDTTLHFIVAESTTNFNNLVCNTPRDVTCMYPFVPELPQTIALQDGTLLIPPMAIQVTVFPNSGFTICINFSHVVTDGKAFHSFIKFWSSLCRSKENNLVALPLHDRDIIQDPNGINPIFLESVWNSPREFIMNPIYNVPNDRVRHRFVLKREQVEILKRLVSTKYQSLLHVSTFVVTCALIWVCKVKSSEDDIKSSGNDEELYLSFWVDCRYLAELKIPLTYFGNCVVNGIVGIKRSKLVGQNGIFEAAVALRSKVKELQSGPYESAETLMSIFSKFATMGHRMTGIAGSPKLDAYESDFGWGKPKLSEVLHVNSPAGVSLSDCRDKEGGIEVGVAFGRAQMQKFNTILEEILADIALHDS
ncbi:coumaroyl-CoA:anthocyanidin 3-O-glucoside-6''-O-coumaroyltransferase 2 isoform X1 [Arachis duranensis]|uniref:Coumaroyl-CoA:anthocyanidin 3-O-glucoside-6''-O-coumaroyltransferase 2 isoform X1 n=1 Tax=Arachis duranensis TaxID=130453 RepID=A0A6P4D7M4_ARADU|nr:coumaroyl-CoA:anthocyanidin 3-O-glucoside-6''-O-coumaroyltransferase 2 isoform X1 [Arachis duranensis]